jgi:hypothetical protein
MAVADLVDEIQSEANVAEDFNRDVAGKWIVPLKWKKSKCDDEQKLKENRIR